jgi:hypothetical protein
VYSFLKQISLQLKPRFSFVVFFFSLLRPIVLYFLWFPCDHVLQLLFLYEEILLQELQYPVEVIHAARRCSGNTPSLHWTNIG